MEKIDLIFFDGYIKNQDALCFELGINTSYDEEKKAGIIVKQGYEKWGCLLPKHLLGYFAFCIYDNETKSYFGARDRFGVIPFFYRDMLRLDEFRCGTYINTLFEENEKKEFDDSTLQEYMTFSYIPGEKTAFKNVKKLMPGSLVKVSKCTIVIEKYWKPTYDVVSYQDETFLEDELCKLVNKSICRDCNHDRKDGFLLSAGLDSNYLFAQSEVKKAYSIGFKDFSCDESCIAEENSNMIGRKTDKIYISPQHFFKNVRLAMEVLEQPLATAASIAFMIGCKSIKGEVDVLYTGEGADELFAGYDIYQDENIYSENNIYIGKANIFSEKEKRKYILHYEERNPLDIVSRYAPREKEMTNLQYMLYVDRVLWLEGNSFLNSYKMSRMNEIELRMPMVDEDIFDFVNTVPDRFIIDGEKNKILLRKIAARVLPSKIYERPKKGFVTPIRFWLADSRYNLDVRHAFNGEVAHMFFDVNEISRLFKEYCEGNYDLWRKVWLIYTFIVWYEGQFV